MLAHLPFPAIEAIAKYCSPQDMAVCCAVNSQMREMFGENILWRRHCTSGLAEYLKNTPCKVHPSFVSPEPEHSTLSPISSARLDFMIENHLWNNWRFGRNFRQEIEKESETNYRFSIWDRFISNDYVMSYMDGPKRIEIFDVRKTPLEDLTVPASSYQYDEMHFSKNIVCLVRNRCVEVRRIDFETKQSTNEHEFFYDKEEKENTSSLFLPTMTGDKSMTLLIGSLLVAVEKRDTTLHIWDIETGLKVRKQDCPLPSGLINQIRISGSKLVLNLSNNVQTANKMSTILVYDLTSLQYQPFKVNFKQPFEYHVCGSFLAILSKRLLNVYNYDTSETVMKDINIGSDTIACFQNSFTFIEDNEIKVCDPLHRQIIKLPIDEKVHGFKVLSDRFLQVTTYYRYELVIWEFPSLERSMRTCTRLDFEVCSYFLNKASTRYIVRYGSHGTLVHFW